MACWILSSPRLEPVIAPAALSVEAFDLHDGAIGNPKTSGMVSGALSFEGRLTLVNTPQRHAAEYSVGIRFGRWITFRFAMTGGTPEGGLHPSQGSAFGFSLLGTARVRALLSLVPDWQRLDPSGFAFLADLDGGELSVSSFLAEGSIQVRGAWPSNPGGRHPLAADSIAYTQTTCSSRTVPTPQSSATLMGKPCSPTSQTFTHTQPYKHGNKTFNNGEVTLNGLTATGSEIRSR